MINWWQGALVGIVCIWLIYAGLPTLWVRHRRRMKGPLLLTFDDGPDSQVTPMVLALLKEYQQHAVFFVTGKAVVGREALLDQIIEDGHELGVHGMDHFNQMWMSPWKAKEDLEKGYDVIFRQGHRPGYYRGPYGSYNLMTLWQCKRYGLTPLPWDGIHQDWKILPEGILYESLCKAHRDGGVVLLHDGQQGNATKGANVLMVGELERFLKRRTVNEN